jgi:hypothetical protein
VYVWSENRERSRPQNVMFHIRITYYCTLEETTDADYKVKVTELPLRLYWPNAILNNNRGLRFEKTFNVTCITADFRSNILKRIYVSLCDH